MFWANAEDFKLKAINQKKKKISGLDDFCTLLHSTGSIIKKHKNIKSSCTPMNAEDIKYI